MQPQTLINSLCWDSVPQDPSWGPCHPSFVQTHCLALPSIPSGFCHSNTGHTSQHLWMSCLSSELPPPVDSVPQRSFPQPTYSQLITGSRTVKCPKPSKLLLLRPKTYIQYHSLQALLLGLSSKPLRILDFRYKLQQLEHKQATAAWLNFWAHVHIILVRRTSVGHTNQIAHFVPKARLTCRRPTPKLGTDSLLDQQ